ncbi:MAG: winged helix-turn-helix transcriptional regulator [Euryarchaeota archaeon]|nr:winged helix-turn-helix transcriptional regulator [Euryarchaeota archaeon]
MHVYGSEPRASAADKLSYAHAEPTRSRLLCAIGSQGPPNVNQLAALCGVSQGCAAHHVRTLIALRIVTASDGRIRLAGAHQTEPLRTPKPTSNRHGEGAATGPQTGEPKELPY